MVSKITSHIYKADLHVEIPWQLLRVKVSWLETQSSTVSWLWSSSGKLLFSTSHTETSIHSIDPCTLIDNNSPGVTRREVILVKYIGPSDSQTL